MKKFFIPEIGEEEVEVVNIKIKKGEKVKKGQILVELEGAKAAMELPAEEKGIIEEIAIKIGDKVKTGKYIIGMKSNKEKEKKKEKNNSSSKSSNSSNISSINNINKNYANKTIEKNNRSKEERNNEEEWKEVYATPMIRKLAREKKINLNEIKGTGRKERITKEDIDIYIQGQTIHSTLLFDPSKENFSTNSSTLNSTVQSNSRGRSSFLKKQISLNLERSWKTIPHVTQFGEVDVTDLDSFRKDFLDSCLKKNLSIKLTLLPFILKSIACSLKKFKKLNASYSSEQHLTILQDSINIGVVVSSNDDLFIPVIKNVDKKSILNLSEELIFLSSKARTGKLSFSEIEMGTFTVSNLGGVGGSFFTPIINAPQVGILGISRTVLKQRWKNNEFVPRLILPLSFSYDHRVVNGVYAVQFLNFLSELLSNIALLNMY